MSASRGRHARPGGIVRALFRLGLLIGFGFSAGLLIGVLAEEPTLLAGHLQGRGEQVPLSTTLDRAAIPPALEAKTEVAPPAVGAPAPMVERPANSSTNPAPARERRDSADVVSPSAPGSGPSWAIQVGAFSDEAAARRLADGLEKKGYPTKLLPSGRDGMRWRVRVQPIGSEAKRDELADRLKRVERLPTWVIALEGRSER